MLETTSHITTTRLHIPFLDLDNGRHVTLRAVMAHGTDRLQTTTGIGRYINSLRSPSIAFTEEKDREYLGALSMQLNRYPNLSCAKIADIGFVLHREYFGKGYATEVYEALMNLLQCLLLALATLLALARPPPPARHALARLRAHAHRAAALLPPLTRPAALADLDLNPLRRLQRRPTAVEARAVAEPLAPA
ncbi:hypothetical protein BJ742DRAFT_770839 [Cladochytrium replicatum]|nr:hypothetical protein BJ742DRAFT_770839 [Cladochytrium replicatum]